MLSTRPDKKYQTLISNQLKKLKYKKKPLTSLIKQQKPISQYQTINQQIMYQRRQNILNSKFNVRKNKLKQITKENHKIYQRINSQKSLYSKQQQQKSYEQLRSISSSRASIKQKKNMKLSFNSCDKKYKSIRNPKKYLTIQQQNIQQLKEQSLRDFQEIFKKDKFESRSFSIQKRQIHKSQQKPNKFLANHKKSVQSKSTYHNRSLSVNPQRESFNGKGGGLLHRIAEQVYGKNKKRRALY